MSRIHILLQQQQQQKTHQKNGYLMSYYYPPPPPFSTPVSFSPPYSTTNSFHKQSSSSSGSKISPAVLFIIVILAVLFFISGLLHLLVRFLIKHPSPPSTSSSNNNNRYAEFATSDALQRQLQQLFHLHDSGLDQAFIDALPVFQYREIVGPKEPFDCPVCLSEFSDKDNLRLLPVCSHAFHIACIDTWLLSNSTCPLCRGTLFANPGPGFCADNPVFAFDDDNAKEEEIEEEEEEEEPVAVKAAKGVLPVRLGKFRRVGPEPTVGETSASSSSRLDARRCFSMGSYEYVLGDSVLRVPLRKVQEQQQQQHGGGGGSDNSGGDSAEGKKISSVSKGESFSVSKIWLWPKKGKFSPSDSDSGMPSSLNVDLPWMGKTQQGY